VRDCRPVRGAGSLGAPLLALPQRQRLSLPMSQKAFGDAARIALGKWDLPAHPPRQRPALLGTNRQSCGCHAKPLLLKGPSRCGGAAHPLVKGPRSPAQSSPLSAQLPSCSLPSWHSRCGRTRRPCARRRPRTYQITKRGRPRRQVPQREPIERYCLLGARSTRRTESAGHASARRIVVDHDESAASGQVAGERVEGQRRRAL